MPFVDPDAQPGKSNFVDPDEDASTRESIAAINASSGAGMVKLGLGAMSTVSRAAKAAGDYVSDKVASATGINLGHVPDVQDALMGAMVEADQIAGKYQLRPGQSPNLTGSIAGGVLTLPEAMASWPQHGIDVANEVLSRGGSKAEAAEAAIPVVGFDAAMQLLKVPESALAKTGLGAVGKQVASRSAMAVGNVGLGIAERATENATLPDRPEFSDMQQPLAPTVAEAVSEAGMGILAGGPHGHGEANAAPKATVADQLRQAAALLHGEKPEPAPQTVNYDIPPGQRGVPRLPPSTKGLDVSEAEGINMPHPNDRAPSMDLSPDSFVDDRPEAQPGTEGILAKPASKGDVEGIQAAPAPKDDLGEITDEQIKAAPAPQDEAPAITKSDRQVELERLRSLAAHPDVQAALDKQISAEQTKATKAFEAEQKQRQDDQAAKEMRVLAANTDDPKIRADMLAKAEKLSPTPAPEQAKPAESKSEPSEPPAAPAEAPQEPTPPTNPPAGAAPAGEGPGEPHAAAEPDPYTPAARADELRSMAQHETGWAQKGGSIIRGRGQGESHGGDDPVVGRTTWIPQSEWYGDMRRAYPKTASLMREDHIQAAVEKAIKGEPLKAAEQRTIDTMMDEIKRRDAHEHASHLQDHAHEPEHVDDHAALARANEIDPDGVERLAMKHQDDPDHKAFMEDVRKLLDANPTADDAGRASPEPRSGGEAEKPAVRGEPEKGADVEPATDALRGEQGTGKSADGDGTGAGSEVQPAGAKRGDEAAAEAGKPVEEPFSLENPTPQTLKERDQVAKDAAAGQPPLLLRKDGIGEVGTPAERAKAEKRQKTLDTHEKVLRQKLEDLGLGWVSKNTDFEIDPTIKGAGIARVRDGRFIVGIHPDSLDMKANDIAHILLHETAHGLDMQGFAYSQHGDLAVTKKGDRFVPTGIVAQEMHALAARDPRFETLYRYPMDPAYAKDMDADGYRSELFAQSFAAYHNATLRKVMENEAPNLTKFMADAQAHAVESGSAPASNAGFADHAESIRKSFDASRPTGGVSERGEPAGLRHEPGREVIPAREIQTPKEDLNEAKTFGKILRENFRPAQLRRMAEAAREEDVKLAKGKVDNMKGLASLPKEQREVMEFLQGRGYTDTALDHLLGSNYHVYAGVKVPERTGETGGLGDTLAKWLHPASRGEIAEHQAGIMRANFGEMARTRELAFEKLKGLAKEFNKRSNADNVDFFDRMERGQAQPSPQMQKEADALRGFLDNKRKEVQDLGTGKLEQFNENYMPHIYQEKDAAQALFSRRPLEGSKAFLMRRSIPFQKDAMRWRSYDEDGNFLASHDSKEEAEAANAAYADKRLAAAEQALPKAQVEYEAAKAAVKAADTAPKIRKAMEARDEAGDKLKAARGEVDSAQAFAARGGAEAGKPLTPISANPVELALLKAREMDRYIAGQRIFSEMKAQGLASLVGHEEKAPDGYTKINDKIANGGAQGQYYAPDEAATLLNNHVSPGLRGNSVYDALRGVSNALNGLQLGLSAFHVGFTTLDSMISRSSLGIKQISRGDVVKGAYNLAQGVNPAQPFVNIYKGDRLLKAYLGKLDSPEMAPIVAALQQAGGRVRMDDFYRNATVNAFTQAVRAGRWGAAAKSFLPTVLDRINAPIFEHLVPRQKLGVFFDMAKDHLEAHPDEDVQTRTANLGKLWDSVDNRMGQLVYDNVFWNHALKDSLMLSVRSVGWNLGTFRELGGGVMDLKDIRKNKALSDRTAYAIALPLLAGVYGALTQQLYGAANGKSVEDSMPQSAQDLYAPRTFKQRPDGTDDRVQLATYMKDVFAYYKDGRDALKYGGDPFQTLENKLNPAISTVAQIVHNQDFFGAAIRNPADGPGRQIMDEAKHLMQQFEPFSARNFAQQRQTAGEEGGAMSHPLDYINPLANPAIIGVTPAPGYMTKTDEQNESSQISRLREPLIQKFRAEMAEPDADRATVEARMKASGLSKQDIKYVLRSAGGHLQGRTKAFGEMPDESRP